MLNNAFSSKAQIFNLSLSLLPINLSMTSFVTKDGSFRLFDDTEVQQIEFSLQLMTNIEYLKELDQLINSSSLADVENGLNKLHSQLKPFKFVDKPFFLHTHEEKTAEFVILIHSHILKKLTALINYRSESSLNYFYTTKFIKIMQIYTNLIWLTIVSSEETDAIVLKSNLSKKYNDTLQKILFDCHSIFKTEFPNLLASNNDKIIKGAVKYGLQASLQHESFAKEFLGGEQIDYLLSQIVNFEAENPTSGVLSKHLSYFILVAQIILKYNSNGLFQNAKQTLFNYVPFVLDQVFKTNYYNPFCMAMILLGYVAMFEDFDETKDLTNVQNYFFAMLPTIQDYSLASRCFFFIIRNLLSNTKKFVSSFKNLLNMDTFTRLNKQVERVSRDYFLSGFVNVVEDAIHRHKIHVCNSNMIEDVVTTVSKVITYSDSPTDLRFILMLTHILKLDIGFLINKIFQLTIIPATFKILAKIFESNSDYFQQFFFTNLSLSRIDNFCDCLLVVFHLFSNQNLLLNQSHWTAINYDNLCLLADSLESLTKLDSSKVNISQVAFNKKMLKMADLSPYELVYHIVQGLTVHIKENGQNIRMKVEHFAKIDKTINDMLSFLTNECQEELQNVIESASSELVLTVRAMLHPDLKFTEFVFNDLTGITYEDVWNKLSSFFGPLKFLMEYHSKVKVDENNFSQLIDMTVEKKYGATYNKELDITIDVIAVPPVKSGNYISAKCRICFRVENVPNLPPNNVYVCANCKWLYLN